MLTNYIPIFVRNAKKTSDGKVMVDTVDIHGVSQSIQKALLKGTDGEEYFYVDSKRYTLKDNFKKILQQRITEFYFG